MSSRIKKILVANRGEIAVRVIRAARELGIATVAVYSEVDRGALHVRKADEAYCIGPAPARDSYLSLDKILAVTQRSGADAIHPGYGFLSENAAFAQACADAGVKFIGPPASAMRVMGAKTSARQAVEQAGLPRVPGSTRALESLQEAREVAGALGYPVMLKAAAGGGGKGMRLVSGERELTAAFDTARSEAQNAFGNGDVYLEKCIVNPRHIEVQILADQHGNVVHLGERECSLQRRHQKVLEEAPSAVVDTALRKRMGETAVQVAKIAGYVNAGTVEFLVDRQRNFYFLEMNTRLQVEHPVTELVTGLDLVHLQIRIAEGEPIPFRQDEIQLRGHAIECRIYAEDPNNDFFPSPGKITALAVPGGPGIREDSGVYEGWNVPLEYDPLLSKLIAYGPDREMAIERLLRALEEYFIGGIATNLNLFRCLLRDPQFRRAEMDTGFLDRWLKDSALGKSQEGGRRNIGSVAALGAALLASKREAKNGAIAASQPQPGGTETVRADSASSSPSGWKRAARWDSRR